MESYDDKVEKLRHYSVGTLAHDMAKCLDDRGLRLVPKFESHDLKHVLLGYEMTPVDEIRMQAFMLGNRNHSLPCFAILAFGMLLLPDEWATFYDDFKRGRKSQPISHWTIEEFAGLQTLTLRRQVMEPRNNHQTIFIMETLTKYGAITSILAGVFGMLFCLPFLFSSNMADLVGAGFPFVGGAVLAVGGLIALSNLTKHPQHALSESPKC